MAFELVEGLDLEARLEGGPLPARRSAGHRDRDALEVEVAIRDVERQQASGRELGDVGATASHVMRWTGTASELKASRTMAP